MDFNPLGTTLKALLLKPSGNQAAARRPVQPSAAYQHFAKTSRRAAAEQPLVTEQDAVTAPHSRFHVLVLPNHGRCGALDHWPQTPLPRITPAEREGGRSRHTRSRSPTAWIPAHHTHLRDGPAPAHRFNASPLSSSLLASASGTTRCVQMLKRPDRHCLAADTAPGGFRHPDFLLAAHSQSQAFETPG